MATTIQHITFEILGVLLGIFLIVAGTLILKNIKRNKLVRTLSWLLILFGIAGVIIDSWFLTTF